MDAPDWSPVGSGHWRSPPRPALDPILVAALDLFSAGGYHATSVRDIARDVGCTVPALYYHHANKEAMLFALLERGIDHLIGACTEALDDAGGEPVQRFRNLVEAMVRHMAANTKLAALDAEIRSLSPDHFAVYRRKRRHIEQLLASTIREGLDSGRFHVTSPEDTARALLGMIQAIAVWYRPHGRLSVRAIATRYLDIAMNTVGAATDAALIAVAVPTREVGDTRVPDS